MAQKLKCIAEYTNKARGLYYKPGQIFDASSSLRDFLMNNARGCFVDYNPRSKRVKRPAENKAIMAAQEDK